MMEKRIKRIAFALRIIYVLSFGLLLFSEFHDLVTGFKDGYRWDEQQERLGMRHDVQVVPLKDSTWCETEQLSITGATMLRVREKKDAPAPAWPLRLLDISLSLLAFVILYWVIKLLILAFRLIRRFERNEWLQPLAVVQLNKLGKLHLFTGFAILAWELLHAMYLQQRFSIPGYKIHFSFQGDFGFISFGLVLMGIAAVLQYTQELKAEQELTV